MATNGQFYCPPLGRSHWPLTTTTQAGLTVQAAYDPGWYQRGIKITNTQMEQLPLRPHHWHGEWNYTITPN